MKLNETKRITGKGVTAVFRSACEADAVQEIAYLKRVCGESRFLLSEPEDVALTEEGERAFLRDYEAAPNTLMLNVYVDGRMAGNSSFAPVGGKPRVAHRASMGIAIFEEFWGKGIGEEMISLMFEKAKECGYEIMELDVVTENERAVHLYRKMGFEIVGTIHRSMKYKDGSYADEYLMQKNL